MSRKTIIIIIVLILLVAGGVIWYYMSNKKPAVTSSYSHSGPNANVSSTGIPPPHSVTSTING